MAIERMPKNGGKSVPDTPAETKKASKKLKSDLKKTSAAARGGKPLITASPSRAKKKVQNEKDSSKMKEAETVSRKATKKPKRQKVDWIQAAALYATDASQTFESIAKVYGVHARTVERRAKKEKWSERRKNAGELVVNEASKLAAQSAEQANSRHLEYWSEAQDLVITRLRKIRTDADSESNLPFDTKGMKQTVEALKITIEGERTARGLPNSVVRNQNENKDVDDFADLDDDEIERLINEDEHGSTEQPETETS